MTIAELSELTGISKVSLYSLIKKPEYVSCISKVDGKTVIDDTGVALIRAYYSGEREAAFKDALNGDNPEMVAFLQEQLREKDSQINSLLTLLKNEQQLKAMPMLAAPPEEKPGFFRRLFGKG
jgi:hypothetical protein